MTRQPKSDTPSDVMPRLTVDQALALVEQERLDEMTYLEPGDEHYESAPYVLASEVRKLRIALSERGPSKDRIDELINKHTDKDGYANTDDMEQFAAALLSERK